MSNQNWNAPGPHAHPSPQPPGRPKANWKLPLLIGAPALALIVGIGGCVAIGQPQEPTTTPPTATPPATPPASQSPAPTPTDTDEPLASAVPAMEELPATIGAWEYTPVSDTQGFFSRPDDPYIVLATSEIATIQERAQTLDDDTFLADNTIVCGSAFDGIMCYISTPNHGYISLGGSDGQPPMPELQALATDLLAALS